MKIENVKMMKYIVEDGVKFELTKEEAEILFNILGHIAGNPKSKLRKFTSDFSSELAKSLNIKENAYCYYYNYHDVNYCGNKFDITGVLQVVEK